MTSTDRGLGELHTAEVDGVPAVWTDAPGPYAGGLLLRVGTVDETLRQRGTTHMLEHLALFGLGRPGEHSNGRVDTTTLGVHVVGEPVEVAEFLTRAADQLARPPVLRLEDEKGVLRAERAQQQRGILEELFTWRWGAFGFAMEAHPEYGLPLLDAEDLTRWAATYACRQNAALWFSGPPPAGLRVSLHDGDRRPLPDPYVSPLPAFRAYFRSAKPVVALHGLVPRSAAAVAVSSLLHTRLVDDLRTARAAAYSPTAAYRPLTTDTASIAAVSDIVPGRDAEVVDRLMSTLGELAAPGGAVEAELDAHRRRVRASLEAPGAAIGHVTSAAWNLVHGAQVQGIDEILTELDALTPDDVVRAARHVDTTVVAQVPGGAQVQPLWVAAPESTSAPVTDGRTFAQRGGEAQLVVGDAGVTLRAGAARATVRWENVAGVGEWDDGGRVVIGVDGLQLAVEPTLWRGGRHAVALIDRSAPWDRVLPLGARPTSAVPRPPSAWTRAKRNWRGLVAIAALLAWGGASIPASITGHEGLTVAAGLVTVALIIGWIVVVSRGSRQGTPR